MPAYAARAVTGRSRRSALGRRSARYAVCAANRSSTPAASQRSGVAIDDLYTFAQRRLAEIQLPANVHFKPGGYKQLAEQVAASVEMVLKSK